jgi:hypothetical protein
MLGTSEAHLLFLSSIGVSFCSHCRVDNLRIVDSPFSLQTTMHRIAAQDYANLAQILQVSYRRAHPLALSRHTSTIAHGK